MPRLPTLGRSIPEDKHIVRPQQSPQLDHYFVPNAGTAEDYLNMLHYINCFLLRSRLFRAPAEGPLEILDVGAGNGIWAQDFADRFPTARVLGIDINPRGQDQVRPNLCMGIFDCEQAWNFDRTFDFIHIRHMNGAINDWPALMRKCYHFLSPGGWIECSDIEAWSQRDGHCLGRNSASLQWQMDIKENAYVAGTDPNVAPRLANLVRDAGFEHVRHVQHILPMSAWLGEIGDRGIDRQSQHFPWSEQEAWSLRLYTRRMAGFSLDESTATLIDVRKEIKDPSNQMFSRLHYVTGRKPKNV